MPTLAGYVTFIATVMGITTTVLPSDSPVIPMSFNVAVALVNTQLQQANCELYTLAVYNLAGDRLLNFAQDQVGQTFFADQRQQFGLNNFTAGVISSTGDEGTNESMVTPEVMNNLSFLDLQTLKTPYGRTYLGLAQSVGSLWGLS